MGPPWGRGRGDERGVGGPGGAGEGGREASQTLGAGVEGSHDASWVLELRTVGSICQMRGASQVGVAVVVTRGGSC